MWQPNRAQWCVIWIAATVLIVAWPPAEGRSLAVKVVNWMADPARELPALPPPLPMGLGDNAEFVADHDSQEAEYYRIQASPGIMRTRLRLKVADDPFDPSTERQILTGLGILAGLVVWRLGGRPSQPTSRV